MKRALLFGLTVFILTACGSINGDGATTETPAVAAGTTPNALSLVNCPPTGQGPTGGSLTGLGASIGAFEDAHQPRDKQHGAEFGQMWSGATNNGLHEFSPRCTQAGWVGSVTHYLGGPVTAAQVKAGIQHDGIAPLQDGKVRQKFYALLKAAGLPKIKFHGLRHSCASFLIAKGVPARMVMEWMRHSQISTTMNIYGHIIPTLRQQAVDAMDSMFARKTV